MEIPENVTSMGGHVFTYCPNLRSITFLADLKSIPSDTFQGCESLISVTLPKSLVEIESSAFRGCSKLESISLPEGLESIGSDAFFACPISSDIISIELSQNTYRIVVDSKAYVPTLTTEAGTLIYSSFVSLKAPPPIFLTVLGIMTDEIGQAKKASEPML